MSAISSCNHNRVRMSLRGTKQYYHNYFLVFVGTDYIRLIHCGEIFALSSYKSTTTVGTYPSGLGVGSSFLFKKVV